MAFFRFIGDPNDDGSGPDEIEWDGFVFGRDGWTEVPDDRCAKLRGNGHFEERSAVQTMETPLDVSPVKRRGRPPGRRK